MEGCLQVISREIVKPSSQIHHHLKKFKRSYLDQLMPPMYIPIIFFYQADESKGLTTSNHVQISHHLKHSLSDTLTSFYPLAGRFESHDNVVVDCNGAGVEFIDARVHAHLMDAIEDPNMEELKQYIPIDPTCEAISPSEKPFLLVQITFFDCGGIALGVCFSHLIADCKSIMAFIDAWAATCREKPQVSQLINFNLAHYFPEREFPGPSIWGLVMSNEKFATKRFVFDKDMLAHLKQDAISSSRSIVKDPTRVELVSAFIWKHFIKVAKFNNPKTTKTFAAIHLVNLRARKSPSHLLENVFGNCLMLSLASNQHEDVEEFHDVVSELRSSIRKIDDDYITKAQSGDCYLNDLYKLISLFINGEGECCTFSSWCRFPLYEVDYGFGKPIWLCTTALPLKNLIILVNSKYGEKIEAWVNMEQHNLEMLENQINLISGNVRDSEL